MDNKYTGVINKPSSLFIYEYDTVCGSSNDDVELPDKYMLPEDRIPDCRDQKKTCQCVAFAITNIMQIMNKIEAGDNEQFSTTYVYGKHRDEKSRMGKGMFPEKVLEYMTKLGSCKHKDLPDLLENPEAFDLVQNRPDLDKKAEPYKIASYVIFNGKRDKKIQSIKEALLKYQYPVLGTFEESDGGHAVAIIGWNDIQEILYVMNSWGDRGGNKGITSYKYKKLKRGYLMLDAKNTNLMPFEDVPEEHWAYKTIQHAYNSGIMNGTSKNTFEPDRAPTRAELAAFGVNIMEKLDKILENMG